MQVHGVNIVELISFLEPLFCVFALFCLYRAKETKNYFALSTLVGLRLLSDLVCLGLLEGSSRIFERHFAYDTYFYVYWISFALDALLSLFVILSIFRLAMAPLKGLQNLGMLVFRWAAAISVAVAVAIGFSPHQSSAKFLVSAVSQLQQISSVLTLCLLLFVCFAIRPLGLSFRSRIFGVSLGLGLTAVTNLATAAWLVHSPHLFTTLNFIAGCVGCSTVILWTVYFALPEPKRRIIVLPTTSPFLRWNQISEALGDEPGYVAIAGVPPEVFAPAELEVMARASAMMAPVNFHPAEAISPVTLKSLTA